MRLLELRFLSTVLILWFAAPPAPAQLTTDQKLVDFQAVAAPYAKWYAPYELKKSLFQFDALNLTPWMDEIRQTQNDLDYLGLLVRYVARLNDSHSHYSIPSSFYAVLGFHTDAYFDTGRQNYAVLIDAINRAALPQDLYPFEPGDEVVSVDGTPARDLIERFTPYVNAATRDAKVREAAYYVVYRDQSVLPRAHEIGESALVEIKRKSGVQEIYVVPWRKHGTPITAIGPARPVKTQVEQPRRAAADPRPYMQPLLQFRTDMIRPVAVLNFGALEPVWDLPPSFQLHMGEGSGDNFYTGVMISEGFRIGYLRIPTFLPENGDALSQLEEEVQYLEANTDGLVLDVMRNGGGDMCYEEDVVSRFMPERWRAMGLEMRPTWALVVDLQEGLDVATARGEDLALLTMYSALVREFRSAYNENRMTAPSSVCYLSLDRPPGDVHYSKPILLLTDEFSASAADSFAVLFQDNRRGKVFGYRTNGAGGSVIGGTVGFYSEFGSAYVTNSLMYRPAEVAANGYAPSHAVENSGAQPDIVFDYMRPEVLAQNGKPFVDAFLSAIVTEIVAAGGQPSVPTSAAELNAAAARRKSPKPGSWTVGGPGRSGSGR